VSLDIDVLVGRGRAGQRSNDDRPSPTISDPEMQTAAFPPNSSGGADAAKTPAKGSSSYPEHNPNLPPR